MPHDTSLALVTLMDHCTGARYGFTISSIDRKPTKTSTGLSETPTKIATSMMHAGLTQSKIIDLAESTHDRGRRSQNKSSVWRCWCCLSLALLASPVKGLSFFG